LTVFLIVICLPSFILSAAALRKCLNQILIDSGVATMAAQADTALCEKAFIAIDDGIVEQGVIPAYALLSPLASS
jgi:hypothetical protein